MGVDGALGDRMEAAAGAGVPVRAFPRRVGRERAPRDVPVVIAFSSATTAATSSSTTVSGGVGGGSGAAGST